MASTQSHLPIEIWDQIISYLPHQYDRDDGFAFARGPAQPSPDNANLETMYNLRLVNKALFAVVRRHLYTKFMHFKPWPRRDLRKCFNQHLEGIVRWEPAEGYLLPDGER